MGRTKPRKTYRRRGRSSARSRMRTSRNSKRRRLTKTYRKKRVPKTHRKYRKRRSRMRGGSVQVPNTRTGMLDESFETRGGQSTSAPAESGKHVPRPSKSLVRLGSEPTKFLTNTEYLERFGKAMERQATMVEVGGTHTQALQEMFSFEPGVDAELLAVFVESIIDGERSGMGSFGTVYNHTLQGTGKKVAVKIVNNPQMSDSEFKDKVLESIIQNFVAEVCPGAAPADTHIRIADRSFLQRKAMGLYSQERIDTLAERIPESVSVFILMEGLDMTLSGFMRLPYQPQTRPMHRELADVGDDNRRARNMAEIFLQMLDHLECMQRNYICHTDMKPANIMLKFEGAEAEGCEPENVRVIFIDFPGILLGDHERGPPDGTPRYTAPECWGVPIPKKTNAEEILPEENFPEHLADSRLGSRVKPRVRLRTISPSCNMWSFAIIFVEYYNAYTQGFSDMFSEFQRAYNAMEYVIKLQMIALNKPTDHLVERMKTLLNNEFKFLNPAVKNRIINAIANCFHIDAARRTKPHILQSILTREVLIQLFMEGHRGSAVPHPFAPRGRIGPSIFAESSSLEPVSEEPDVDPLISFNVQDELVHILTQIPEEFVRYTNASEDEGEGAGSEVVHRDPTGSIRMRSHLKIYNEGEMQITGHTKRGIYTYYHLAYHLDGTSGITELRYSELLKIKKLMISPSAILGVNPLTEPDRRRIKQISFPPKGIKVNIDDRMRELNVWLQQVITDEDETAAARVKKFLIDLLTLPEYSERTVTTRCLKDLATAAASGLAESGARADEASAQSMDPRLSAFPDDDEASI